MTKMMSYNEVMIIQNDIEVQLSKSPAISFFLGDKIQRFFQRNATRINHMNEKMMSLQKRYIKQNENGVPILIDKDFDYLDEAVNGKGITVTGEEVRSAYREEASEFLATSFRVEW